MSAPITQGGHNNQKNKVSDSITNRTLRSSLRVVKKQSHSLVAGFTDQNDITVVEDRCATAELKKRPIQAQYHQCTLLLLCHSQHMPAPLHKCSSAQHTTLISNTKKYETHIMWLLIAYHICRYTQFANTRLVQ